jgi:sulfur relay (sulfurtransferase) DsrF/TusC family protein
VLVDDGVYLAKTDQNPGEDEWLALGETLEEVIARGLYERKDEPAEFYCEKESLGKRGLSKDDVVEDLELIDHQRVSELLAANHHQLIF